MELTADNAGKFLSRGKGKHPVRIIDSWELIWVVSGELKLFIGEKNYCRSAGGCFLIPPGVKHGGTENFPPSLSFCWIHFQPGNRAAKRHLQKLPHCFTASGRGLGDYFSLFLSVQERNPEDKTALNLILQLIFHEAFEAPPENTAKTPPPLVLAADDIIRLNFRERLSTSSVAGQLHCTPDYLGRLYRQWRHMTVVEAINRCRIGHAQKKLAQETMTIAETAYDSGFDSPGYFRRMFRRDCGMTPAEYRRRKCAVHTNTE